MKVIKLALILLAAACMAHVLIFAGATPALAGEGRTFVGAEACKNCHSSEYFRFTQYSKKVHSFTHVKLMRKGLTEDEFKSCLECHTTGYGQPGGFVSESQTPHLMLVGCESCHGPGSAHVSSQAAKDIKGRLSLTDCERCHNKDRVDAFNFRPLVYGGAH